jgi:FKBP-type peptidyl-prolyl cis-trans isomerase 2
MVSETKKMLEVNFTGKELLNGETFDTTIENVAKEKNIFNEKRKYGPLTIITGEKELHKKVESELEKMKVGEEKKIHLTAKEGFGERKQDLVRIVPLKVFQEQKINPVPGLVINLGDMLARVQSVSGGRVRIDLNHPLAGRELEYTVKLEKEVKGKKERAEKIFEKYYSQVPGVKKEIKEDNLYITIPSSTLKGLEKVNETIKKLAKDLDVKLEIKEGKETEKKDKDSEKK